MPFSSGTFSVVYNWTTESGASPIEIAKLDTQHADFATGLSNCILRDGTGLPTAAIPFNSQNITGVAELQAARFVPTGSTVPTNGMYLSAANTVAFASNTTLRAAVNSAGNWTFAAPSSGASIASQGPITVTISGITQTIGTDGTGPFLDIAGANSWRLFTNSTQRLTVGSAGNVTIAAPSSGTALTVTSASGAYASTLSSGGSALSAGYNIGLLSNAWNLHTTGTDPFVFGTISAATASLYTDSTQRILIGTAGNVTINAPSSGNALTVNGNTIIDTGAITWTIAEDGSGAYLDLSGSNNFRIYTGTAERIRVGNAGNVTINAASSGDELTVTGSVVATSFAGALTGDVTGNVSGNAGTATILQTARNINGVSFNGSANITVTAAAETLSGSALPALSGASLTALNATQLTSGTVPDARFPATLPALNGSALTALNATQLTSGTVPSARITAVDAAATISSNLIGYRDVVRRTSGFARGECSAISAGVTLNTSDMAAGYTFSLYNDSASAITLTQGAGVTMRLGGTTTTGNRTIAARGLATIWCNSGTEAIVTGSGVS